MELFVKFWKRKSYIRACPSLVFFCLLFTVIPVSGVFKEDLSLDADFRFVGKDSVLIEHVVAVYYVEEFHQCTIKCTSHPKCKSINYKYTNDNSSLQTCEINDATKSQTPTQFFIIRIGFLFYEMVINYEKESYDPSCVKNGAKSNCNCPGQYDGANCQIFYPKSCKDYQTKFGYRQDGEYYLYLNWPECKIGAVIYCAKMRGTKALEYVTLPAGIEKNFAGRWNKNLNKEVNTGFEKIRFLLLEKEINREDYKFASSKGSFSPYATAGDCVSRSCNGAYRKGRLSVDLTGTSFRLPPTIPYDFHSFPVCVRKVYAASMSEDQLRWSGKCGGSCGSCWPKIFKLLINGC